MHFDLWIAIAGLLVGFVVGLTGMGGGALMTPILVLVFNVAPLAAVSSDLVAALVMKPIGGGVHLKRGTVHRDLVRWLLVGSVPAAFCGALLLDSLDATGLEDTMKTMLGVALLVASAAMVVRAAIARRRPVEFDPEHPLAHRAPVRVVPTVLIGLVGGLVVGLTSVGSGSLMIVGLMLLYPMMSSAELVGTDLVQAIPLVGAAALGHALFGSVSFGLTTSLLVGGIPGVYLGARVSSRAPDAIVRPALLLVLLLSGLKLLGAPNAALLAVLVVALGAAVGAVVQHRRRAANALVAPALVE